VRELLRVQSLHDAAIRLTLSRGAGPRGLMPPDEAAPLLMIRAFPLNPAVSPVRAILAPTPRNERSPVSGMKTLGCLDQILCLRAARRAGCDEAIMLNTQGAIACATTANIFIVKNGRVFTPGLSSGILPGITRARLIEALPGVTERAVSVAELADADEAFLTNSLTGIRPLVEWDGRPIGQGSPGPITTEAAGCLE
jgi:branched-chain amino acid aminotransferase